MSTMKPIPPDSYHVRPIITHKTQQFIYTYLGSDNEEGVSVNLAVMPPNVYNWKFDPDNEAKNDDGTYQRPLYASLNHLFYGSGSVWNRGEQLQIPSGSQIYVFSIAQAKYSEKIYPGSFSVSVASSSGSIVDDGEGKLRYGESGSVVGHIFYGLGIATVQHNSGSAVNSGGMNLTTGSVLDITFKASHTIYEHSIMCTMDIGDMNFSMNPSIKGTNDDGVRIVDGFISGTLTPYMTTIGLYNNQNQLLAVAKFPRPIKRASDSQQTVIIRFDA